jgi:hypothetical protein
MGWRFVGFCLIGEDFRGFVADDDHGDEKDREQDEG